MSDERKGNWLYDENGKIRKGLYTTYPAEIEKLAREIDAELALPYEPWLPTPSIAEICRHQTPMVRSRFAKSLFIQQGDRIRVHPHYTIATQYDGWMTVVRACMNPVMGLSILAQCEDGTGGFISSQMVVEWRCSRIDSLDPRQPGWYA